MTEKGRPKQRVERASLLQRRLVRPRAWRELGAPARDRAAPASSDRARRRLRVGATCRALKLGGAGGHLFVSRTIRAPAQCGLHAEVLATTHLCRGATSAISAVDWTVHASRDRSTLNRSLHNGSDLELNQILHQSIHRSHYPLHHRLHCPSHHIHIHSHLAGLDLHRKTFFHSDK